MRISTNLFKPHHVNPGAFMTPFLMIIILGYQATYLEFSTQTACREAKATLTKDFNDPKVAIQCFQKIGGRNKES